MAGTGVGKFSSTAGSNTANMTVNFAENMAPSNVNNAARELMGHMRDMYEQLGDGYFEFGDGDGTYTVARGDADTITLTSASDLSGVYFPGRKIRITDGGANVVEGTIASSSHASTTQTVNLTGISLASGTPTKVELGIDTAAFGGRVILDDDGDTYIEAPTDDTIDIYVAGAKDFVITANTFTAESGSSIVTPTLEVTSAVTLPAGATNIATLDIDGATDIGADIVDADLFIIDDGAGGTNRKVTAARIKTYAASDLGSAGTATSLAGIPFYTADNSIYTHDVSGTDSTAEFNTAYGLTAMDAITTGDFNTAVGYNAAGALNTGATNTCVGVEAGKDLTSGSNNLLLGVEAGRSNSPATVTTGSNNIVLGNNSITDAAIRVDWTVTSDKRDKADVEALTMGLDFVNKLNPVTYRWDMRSDYDDDATPDGTHKKQRLFSGLLAQDVEVLEREYGYKVEDETALITSKGENGNYGLTYQRLIPVLINAVKELSAEVKTLKGE